MLDNFLRSWPDPRLPFYCKSVRAKLPATGGSIFPQWSPAGSRCKSMPKPWRQAERTVHPKDYSYFPQKSQRDYTEPLCAKPTSECKDATSPPQSPENKGKLDLCLSKPNWDVGTWQTLLGKRTLESGCPTSPPPWSAWVTTPGTGGDLLLLQNVLSPEVEGDLWKRGRKDCERESEDQGVCCELCLPVTWAALSVSSLTWLNETQTSVMPVSMPSWMGKGHRPHEGHYIHSMGYI